MKVRGAVSLLLMLLLLGLTAAQQVTKYFEIGGTLELRPDFSGPITSIIWKHKGNLVAEWLKDLIDLEYLGDMKGRLELNLTTGELTVENMTKADDGLFTVEINNRVLPGGFMAVGVRKLDPADVVVRPLTCSGQTPECSLACGGDLKDAGPVQYFWKVGDCGEWKEGEKRLRISKDEETLKINSFTCRAKNPISEEESSPENNPFLPDGP